jgi:hypothetical protein
MNVLCGDEAIVEEWGVAKGLTFLIQDKLCVCANSTKTP